MTEESESVVVVFFFWKNLNLFFFIEPFKFFHTRISIKFKEKQILVFPKEKATYYIRWLRPHYHSFVVLYSSFILLILFYFCLNCKAQSMALGEIADYCLVPSNAFLGEYYLFNLNFFNWFLLKSSLLKWIEVVWKLDMWRKGKFETITVHTAVSL